MGNNSTNLPSVAKTCQNQYLELSARVLAADEHVELPVVSMALDQG